MNEHRARVPRGHGLRENERRGYGLRENGCEHRDYAHRGCVAHAIHDYAMRGHARRGYGRGHGRNYVPHVSRGRVHDHASDRASDSACPHKPQRAQLHTGGRVSIVVLSYKCLNHIILWHKDTINFWQLYCKIKQSMSLSYKRCLNALCFHTILLILHALLH